MDAARFRRSFEAAPVIEPASPSTVSGGTLALALGGGGARGLAHLGVMEVFEAEGIRPTFIAGSSIGGLVGALWARGVSAANIITAARRFRFPRGFMPGRVVQWEDVFPSVVATLDGWRFEDLDIPLAVSAVDLLAGNEVMLHSGPLLPAIRATCAVPGVLVPERMGGSYLVDGGVMNVLPVDLAWSWEPDVVVAVNIVASPRRSMRLDSHYTRAAIALGRFVPNPMTAHVAYDIAMRAVEIALDRQRALAIAMTGPEMLIDIDLGDVAIDDFQRLDEIVDIGRRASRAELARLRAILPSALCSTPDAGHEFATHIDPVCRMTVSPRRARARLVRDGVVYYFCSTNCLDSFERYGHRHATAWSSCGNGALNPRSAE